jgi:hypothetical protein
MAFPIDWWRAPTARRPERGDAAGGPLRQLTVTLLTAALWVPLALVVTLLALTGILLVAAGAAWRCMAPGAMGRPRGDGRQRTIRSSSA